MVREHVRDGRGARAQARHEVGHVGGGRAAVELGHLGGEARGLAGIPAMAFISCPFSSLAADPDLLLIALQANAVAGAVLHRDGVAVRELRVILNFVGVL